MTRKRTLAAVGIAIALAVIAIALRVSRDSSSPAPAPSATANDEPASPPVAAVTRHRPRALPSGVEPYPELGTDGISTDDPLTAYRKANAYPPGSRPLSNEHTDLLRPNRRHESFRPTDADDGTSFLFTADRYFVFADETLTSTLEVRHGGAVQPVQITAALVAVLDRKTNPQPISIQYSEHNGVWSAQLAPATLHLTGQAAIGMYIEFDAGHGRQRAHYDFQYTPAAGIPARFTGRFRDAVVDGSLVIAANLDVTAPGHYVLDCNLYDASGAPVAWTHWKGDLTAGNRDADLMFFGKVIVDAKARGPFHIGQLRGARFTPGNDPDLEQIAPYDGTYQTKPYATSDFSDTEYDSPQKQRMLQFLADQQAKGVHRGAAAQADPGSPGDGH
jgi:hypothetical protein